jgi:VanZ family protein
VRVGSRRQKKCGTLRGRRRVRLVIPPDPTSRDRRLAFVTDVFPAAAYVGAIFYTGLIRLAKLPELGLVPTDKLLHAVAFGGLALLLVRAGRVLLPRVSFGRRLSLAALGASLLGALLEVCQSFVPYRSAELLDWLADTVGASCAALLLALFVQFVPRRAHG